MVPGAGIQIGELVDAMHKAIGILRSYARDAWADRFAVCLTDIENGHPHGISHVVGLFGGMGSVNDICISAANGDMVDDMSEGAINRRLRDALGRVYELAAEVERQMLTR